MSISKSFHFYTILSLTFVLIIDSLIMGIVFPMMGALFINPHMAIVPAHTSIITRDILYSVTMGIFFFCVIIGAPFLGDLSDIIGRRKVLLISLVIGGLSCLLAAFAISLKLVWLLILARAIAGLSSGNQPLAQASIIDISSPENKAKNIGLITLALCVGFALGPLIGGIFSDDKIFKFLTPSTPFLIAAVLAFLTAVGVSLTFKETFVPSGERTLQFSRGFTLLIEGFRHLKLRRWIWVLLLSQLGWGIYFQSISLILIQNFHYSTGKVGIFMTYLAVLFAIGVGIIVPIALKSFELIPLILFGFLMASVAMVLNMFFIHATIIYWLSLIPFVLGQVFIYTIIMTLMSNAVDKDSQGFAMGIAAAMGSLAWAIAAFIAGAAISFTPYLPFAFALMLFIICYLLTARYQ
jgi:DHA1 family tetracycline resistance protein-like MFS transporter